MDTPAFAAIVRDFDKYVTQFGTAVKVIPNIEAAAIMLDIGKFVQSSFFEQVERRFREDKTLLDANTKQNRIDRAEVDAEKKALKAQENALAGERKAMDAELKIKEWKLGVENGRLAKLKQDVAREQEESTTEKDRLIAREQQSQRDKELVAADRELLETQTKQYSLDMDGLKNGVQELATAKQQHEEQVAQDHLRVQEEDKRLNGVRAQLSEY